MQMDGLIGTDEILCILFLYFSRSYRCIEDKAVIFQSNCQNRYCVGWCQLFLSPLGNYGKSRFIGYLPGWKLKNKTSLWFIDLSFCYLSILVSHNGHFLLILNMVFIYLFHFSLHRHKYITNCKQKLQFTDRFMRCSISW